MALDSTIRDLVARGSARHPELRGKLEHAAFLVLFRDIAPQLDGTWRVQSEHDGTTYTVNLNSDGPFCTCQDSHRHPGEECKHSLAAVMLSRALVGLERHTVFDAPTPVAWETVDDRDYRAEQDVFARLGPVKPLDEVKYLGKLPKVERED
jgi:hypothetical protein